MAKREHPAKDAESRTLAPAALVAAAGDRAAALAHVSDQRSSDVKSAEGQQSASDHRVMEFDPRGRLGPAPRAIVHDLALRDARVTETRLCIGAVNDADKAAARGRHDRRRQVLRGEALHQLGP